VLLVRVISVIRVILLIWVFSVVRITSAVLVSVVWLGLLGLALFWLA
jgi:hypothetical protein